MSGNIDEQIVEMTFKGSSFEAGVKGTVDALTKLKSGLNGLHGSEKDINDLDSAGKRFSLAGMSKGIDAVTHHFSLMHLAGLTVFSSLVRQGLFAGENILKSLTIDPIKAGLDSYETKINAIQTILANTSAAGTTLKQVTAALNQLNEYANKTVYNFGQMAKNIGTFTAAGVGLNQSVSSIKGIANLAALSGSSAEQASTGMYQLSQAIAAGVVKLQDWNSVVNAGFGGKVFQKALIDTARVQGVNVDAMIKKYGSFRQSLQSGWLNAKVLTTTLSEFTGDLSKSQIEALGFTAKESDAIEKQASIAVKSATQVRTVSGLFQDLKEEVATAFASIFQALIGNIGQATKTLSALHNVAEAALTKPIYDLAKILQSFTDLGGRDIVIQAITTAFHALGEVLHTVGAAFHEVFPSNGGSAAQGLITLAFHLLAFANALTPTKKTLEEFKTIFVGVFSAVKIVIDVIKALFGGLTQIGSASTHASGGFLAFIATLAHLVTNLRKAIESGTALQTFFRVLGEVIAFPIKLIGQLVGVLGGFGGAAGKATSAMSKFIAKVGQIFAGLAGAIAAGIKNGNFSAVTGVINQVLLGGVLLSIKKFISGLGKGSDKSGGGLFAGIKESFEALTSTLRTMQQSLKAGILKNIAIAVALLAASLLVLSLINIKDLTKALAAITVMFVQLLAAMSIAIKVGGSAGIVKMEAIGVALNILASALLVLSGVVVILGHLSWEQLGKGLAAIAILLVELVGATALLSTNSKGLIASAIAMEVMAVALNTLALAVILLGKQNLGNLIKGVGAIGALLLILAGFNAISGAQLIGTAAAMVILGAALVIIAQAVTTLGSLSIDTLAKGLVGVAAALAIIAIAMYAMPPTMGLTAVSLLLVASALVVLSKALTTMGAMSWTAVAKSLIELAGSLVIIAAAMYLMTGALPGAAALLVVAAALAILTPVLVALGSLSWEAIAKGLATLAGVFLVLAVGGALLTPLIPTLLGLGVAIALLGVGILAAGAGVALFAVGLTALALAITASGAAILSFVGSILSILPLAAAKLGESIVAFANAISHGSVAIENAFVAIISAVLKGIIKVAPEAGKAFEAVLNTILNAINKDSPRIITTFGNLILRVLGAMNKYLPRFLTAGVNLVVNMINGISSRLGRIVSAGTNLIISFVNAIGNGIYRVVAAGVRMVINLINGIANKIRASSPQIHSAAANLGSAIIEGLISGITGLAGGVGSALLNVAKNALAQAKSWLGINSPAKKAIPLGEGIGEGMALGVHNTAAQVENEATSAGQRAVAAISETLSNLNDVVNSNMDLQPKITPVVDLTQAQQGFSALNKLSKSQLIAATGTTASAMSISASQAAIQAAGAQISPGGTTLAFTQNNYSPENLSPTTIYRRTKNQLSIAKGVLGANTG